MRPVLNYDLFESHLYEAKARNYSQQWNPDWKSLPLWKDLEELGFYEATNSLQKRNETIMLKNNLRIFQGLYPAGLVLQKSGYIRDKAAKSGFIKKYSGDFKIEDMFQYIKDRWIKEEAKIKNVSGRGPLNEDQCIFISRCTSSKWKWNSSTNSVDVRGNVTIFLNYEDGDKEFLSQLGTFKFGKIDGDFSVYIKGKIFDSIEDFAPSSVDSIKIRPILPDTTSGIKTPRGFPKVIKNVVSLSCKSLETLEELEFGSFSLYTPFFSVETFNLESCLLVLKNGSGEFIGGRNGEPVIKKERSTYLSQASKNLDEEAKQLILTALQPKAVAKYIRRNPLKIYLLDEFPELKKEVLEITGLRDISKLGRTISSGLV